MIFPAFTADLIRFAKGGQSIRYRHFAGLVALQTHLRQKFATGQPSGVLSDCLHNCLPPAAASSTATRPGTTACRLAALGILVSGDGNKLSVDGVELLIDLTALLVQPLAVGIQANTFASDVVSKLFGHMDHPVSY